MGRRHILVVLCEHWGSGPVVHPQKDQVDHLSSSELIMMDTTPGGTDGLMDWGWFTHALPAVSRMIFVTFHGNIYIYILIYMCIYIYAYRHTHTHTHTFICIYICIYIYIDTHIYI